MLGHFQLKFKENQDVVPITEGAVPKANESGEIRELYIAICEIPENPSGVGSKRSTKSKRNRKLCGKFKK